MAEPLPKRRRLSGADGDDIANGPSQRNLASLSQPISPPRKKRESRERVIIPSPFRFTTIRDLPKESNVGAVSLHDLLGDPLISECWEFNYLHDVGFLMSHFDEDTRSLVKVHIVHGFWKNGDLNRLALQEHASRHSNVTLHTAFMPEPYGTHHSKMLVLFRHDDTAQVIIHTANMIAKDWTNMTNGVWQSPRLPRLSKSHIVEPAAEGRGDVGGGSKFKFDLLSYLRAYNARRNVCKSLVDDLAEYDFSSVRGSLIASVPGRRALDPENGTATRWGWPGLKQTLQSVPGHTTKATEVVVQISSIATLGVTDLWLERTLFETLSVSNNRPSSLPSGKEHPPRPMFRIVFPTADEIRRSLDGYASGGSIHTKTQSGAQKKQYQYLRPLMCHWANDSEKGLIATPRGQEPRQGGEEEGGGEKPKQKTAPRAPIITGKDAGRKRAAPHIKTYIRYSSSLSSSSSSSPPAIDWALLTSANMSKQAWGEAPNKLGEVRISSWEVGVLVWPDLLAPPPPRRPGANGGKGKGEVMQKAKMVATFRTDVPSEEKEEDDDQGGGPLIGLRVPYNLPLQRYHKTEDPWVATTSHTKPDWMGNIWQGF